MRPLASTILVFGVIAVVLLAVAVQRPSSPPSLSSSSTEPNTGGVGPSPFANDPVILNTVAYAERAINATVYVPDTSVLGGGYRIVGVQITLAPQNDTTSTGVTWRHWIMEFVISNQPFVNGTTLNGVLYSTAVTVDEVSTPAGSTSYSAAIDFMAPPVTCHTFLTNNSSTCSTDSNAGPYKLVQIGSTYLVVDPSVPNAYFVIDGTQRGFQIYASGLTYQQMMNLAATVIP